MSLFRAVAMSLLILVVGCEAASSPETAEYIEIFNQPNTFAGEVNLHSITYVRIIYEDLGSWFPHTLEIKPGESHVFSVMWPGDYRLRIRYDDEHEEVVTDPEMPFYVRNANTTQVYVWY